MTKIRLSPLALSDLQEIKEYITDELCNPTAANRIITKIIKDYSLIETSPRLGPSLSSIIHIDTDYRFLVSGKYIIFYKTEGEYVSIYRILYGARDYMKILFSDKLTGEDPCE